MGVDGIVLAAGFSSRAGSHKMLLELNKTTIIERCIKGMYNICSEIIVVGGYRVEDITRILDKYDRVKVVFNRDFHEGMFSSVKVGLNYVKEERFFLTPGDYPLINSLVYDNMIQHNDDITVPVYKGITGHPVLIRSRLIPQILNQSGHNNLREFINIKGFTAVNIEEPGILIDIDTMEDYYFAAKMIDSKKSRLANSL